MQVGFGYSSCNWRPISSAYFAASLTNELRLTRGIIIIIIIIIKGFILFPPGSRFVRALPLAKVNEISSSIFIISKNEPFPI